MSPVFLRPRTLVGAALLLAATASAALASSTDAVLGWFSSRPLSQQTQWDAPRAEDDLLRQAYILMELSNRTYRSYASSRAVHLLGFRERKWLSKAATMDGGDLGAVLGVTAGGTIDVLSGGATGGAVTIISGIIGHQKIKDQKVTAQALVADSLDGQVRVVALRGSADLPDWILDANAGTVAEGGVTFHHGFFLYAGVLYGDIREQVADACAPGGPKLWLTGHSLGGAAAQIIAYWLARSGCTVDGVMTFAAPLPGMNNLENSYNDLLGDVTHRFMHEDDPVACLPLGLDWAQLGTQHSFTDRSVHLGDRRDLCTGGGDTVAGRAYAFAKKMHDISDPSTELSVWLESTAKEAGFCTENKVGRWFLGIFTAGGSELTCKTLDVVTDLAVLKDQLIRLENMAWNMSNPYKHLPECGYIDRLAEIGSDMGVFMDPIWAQKMENTWDLSNCEPPKARTGGGSAPAPAPPCGHLYCCELLSPTECAQCAPNRDACFK